MYSEIHALIDKNLLNKNNISEAKIFSVHIGIITCNVASLQIVTNQFVII